MMSKGGESDGSKSPNVFMVWEDQLWNFSNSDNSQKERKDMVAGDAGEKRPERGGGSSLKGSSSKGGGDSSEHEIHIQTERERRNKMSNMFSNLHSLLPQLPAKADKSTIVDEAINYIKFLEQTAERLEKQKLERLQGASVVSFIEPPSAVNQLQVQPLHATDSWEAFFADQEKLVAEPKSPTLAPIPELTTDCFHTWASANVTLNVNGEDAHISICTAKKPGLFSLILAVMEKHQLEVVSAHVSSDCFRSMFMIRAHASRARVPFSDMLMIEEKYKSAAEELMILLSTCS